MSFSTQTTNDLNVFFNTDEHATSVTYNGSAIDAIVIYKDDLGDIGAAKAKKAELEVKASDVADPAYRDTVVIGSDTYRVRKILEGDGQTWKLAIESDQRARL